MAKIIRKKIARNLGYPIQDAIRKTKILPTYRFLKESEKWEQQEMEKYRNEKFRKLIEHAYEHVPFYKSFWNKHSVSPKDIKGIKHIEKLPVFNKKIALQHQPEMLAVNHNRKTVKHGKTGGTTGVPLNTINSTEARDFSWGAYYRWYEWMGIEYGDPMLAIWGASTVLSETFKQKASKKFIDIAQNLLSINSFQMNDQTFPTIIKRIQKFKPKMIRGYVSGLYQLAKYINDNNIQGIEPIALSTTSEMLLPNHRSFLQRVFKAPIYDQYGCGECNSVAFECNAHEGLHINEEHTICEILDDDNNVVFDQSGHVVLTDLDNWAMPFIRYDNGDKAILTKNSCACGRNSALLKEIIGRGADIIVLKDGSQVHGVFFTDIIYEIDHEQNNYSANRFQVYQEKAGEIQFRLESPNPMDEAFKEKLTNSLYRFFTKVEVITVPKVQLSSSGKFRYMISKEDIKND